MAIGTRSDASKVLLGNPRKGPEIVENYAFNSSAVLPGVAGCLNSSRQFVAGAANPVIGISRGVSLAHEDRNSVTLKGKEVPLRLTDVGAAASGVIEITSYANLVDAGNDEITVGEVTFVAQSTEATPGEATFQAATSNADTAASLAAQINAHEDLKDLVVAVAEDAEVIVTAKKIGTAGNDIALAYSDKGTETIGATVSGAKLEGGVDSYGYVVPGTAVYVDDVTGYATANDDGTTETNWVYASGVLDGVSSVAGDAGGKCACVNMAG